MWAQAGMTQDRKARRKRGEQFTDIASDGWKEEAMETWGRGADCVDSDKQQIKKGPGGPGLMFF